MNYRSRKLFFTEIDSIVKWHIFTGLQVIEKLKTL